VDSPGQLVTQVGRPFASTVQVWIVGPTAQAIVGTGRPAQADGSGVSDLLEQPALTPTVASARTERRAAGSPRTAAAWFGPGDIPHSSSTAGANSTVA
jgi:hypothetical protein